MLILLLFFLICINCFIDRKIVSPNNIFLGMFFLAFCILKAVNFIDSRLISSETTLIYLLSFGFFLMGSSIYKIALEMSGKSQITISNKKKDKDKKEYWKEIKVLFFLMLVSTIIYIYRIVSSYGLSGLLSSIISAQRDVVFKNVSPLFQYLNFISLFLSPYCFNYLIKFKDNKKRCIIIILATILTNVAYTRNVIFYILVLDILVYLFSSNREKKGINLNWIKYILVILGLFLFFSYTQSLFNKEVDASATLLGIPISPSITTIIAYSVGPLVSTSVYLNSYRYVPFLGFSLRNFRALLSILPFFSFETENYMPVEFVNIPIRFNTTTMQYYIYTEGGWIWLCVFYLLYGVIITSVYYKYKRTNSDLCFMVFVILMLVLIFSIREYLFIRLDVFVFFLILIIIDLKDKFLVRDRIR